MARAWSEFLSNTPMDQRQGHGTKACYRRGCRLPECRNAANLYRQQQRQRKRVVNITDLAVNCWCETAIVYVPAIDITRGVTRSCDAPECDLIEQENRENS